MESTRRFDSLKALAPEKKVYFASDFHLGAPNKGESRIRERKIIEWLEQVRKDASAIFLVGDVFDFWFEYSHVIPKGFTRFLGKLAEISDSGIPIYLFSGNHDLWYKDYFTEELSIAVIHDPISIEIGKTSFYIGHGDGLGKGDRSFKAIKRLFKSGLAQWMFRWLHPDIGVSIANFWSRSSRSKSLSKDEKFLGEQERLFQYAKDVEQTRHHDFYIFGHRHLALEMQISDQATYINLGEWFKSNSYLEFDGQKASLLHFT